MADDRDKILNDLIKYYDGDTTADGDDLESTRVINKAPAAAAAGDTVTVNINKKQPAHSSTADSPMGQTMRISPQDIRKKTPEEPPAREPVQEEVFGLLGLDGKPLQAPPPKPEPPAEKPENAAPSVREEPPVVLRRQRVRSGAEEDERQEEQEINYGLWHMLKPLWVTLILCAILFGGFKFYMTDTGVIGAYKRNFGYNMTMLLELFGIDLDSITNEVPIIGEETDNFVTFADSELMVQSNGTDFNDPAFYNVASADNTEGSADIVHEEAALEYSSAKGGTTLPFEEADSSDFTLSSNGVVCAKSNYICCIDENGEIVWESDTSVANPMVCSAGKYTAAASNGSTQLCVFERGKLLYSLDADDNILSCSISERGDVVLVTSKTAYKGAVIVYNKKGEKIFSWASGTNYITAASMLKTRLVAVSLVDAAENVTSYVMLFNVKSPQPIAGFELENTLIYEVKNNGKYVFPAGDNCIAALTGYDGIRYDMRFDDVRLTHSVTDKTGNRLITYTQSNTPVINLYDKNGQLQYDAVIEATPDFIDVYSSTILYNDGREIICGKYSDEQPSRYTASMEIRRLILLSSKSYVIVYKNSLEFVKI